MTGGQNLMPCVGTETMKNKCLSVSQNDRMNSQAEVAAHEQKHMVVRGIIKILFLVPQSPTETKVSTEVKERVYSVRQPICKLLFRQEWPSTLPQSLVSSRLRANPT